MLTTSNNREPGEKPKVSVLMPALNEEKSIAGAIERVLQQEGVDIELLIIHGRSVDRTGKTIAQIAAYDSRVKVISNPKNIISVALNLGLKHASHDIIARIDAHATISPDYLLRGTKWLDRNARMASVGGYRQGVAQTPVGKAIALTLSSPAAIGDSINHFANEPQLSDHASFGVTRTAVARAVGGWDESLIVNEDVDFDHRITQKGYQIGYDPAMVIGWHVQESLPKLFRQFRRYGRGKGQMLRKNGREALEVRHLIPPAFVVGGTAVALAGLVKPALWLLALPYAAVVAAASVKAWRQRPDGQETSVAALPASFVVVHSSWGLGMLEGFILNLQPYLASGDSRSQ